MNTNAPGQDSDNDDEIEQLVAAKTAGELTDQQRERLNELLRSDDKALEAIVQDLETEALLVWQFGQVAPSSPAQPAGAEPVLSSQHGDRSQRSSALRWAGWIAGAGTVACGLMFALFLQLNGSAPDEQALQRSVANNLTDNRADSLPDTPHNGVDVPDSIRPREPSSLESGWVVTANGDAEYSIRSANEVVLASGELNVNRKTGEDELRIVTPHGTVTSNESRFVVGLHGPQTVGDLTVKPFVRVLVLAGVVTLTNSLGQVQGEDGVLLKAEEGEMPVKIAVDANSAFAWDLYQVLAGTSDDTNVFYSPFSVSSALALAAEGARGETAEEFGSVLHLPEELRRIGAEAQQLPFQAAMYHTGMAQIEKELENADTPEKKKLRAELEQLEKQLAVVNAQIKLADQLGLGRTLGASMKLARETAARINQKRPLINQYELNIANAIWTDGGCRLREEYVETLDGFYKTGGAFTVDFRNTPEAARAEINDWVSEQTKGMIPTTLGPRTVTPLTRLILTNAVYFNGKWREPFRESNTRPADFTLSDGSKIKVPMMRRGNRFARYAAFRGDGATFPTPSEVPLRFGPDKDAEDDPPRYPDSEGFRMVEIPYKGERIAMYLIAPESSDGLKRVEKLLVTGQFENWVKQLRDFSSVFVKMPKFKMETDYDLVPNLQSLGLTRAFIEPTQPGGADFTGMTKDNDELFISKVIHKARLEVNEEGTKAAAVTAIGADTASAAPQKMVPFRPEFNADRPFVLVIRDKVTGTILFVGRNVKPE